MTNPSSRKGGNHEKVPVEKVPLPKGPGTGHDGAFPSKVVDPSDILDPTGKLDPFAKEALYQHVNAYPSNAARGVEGRRDGVGIFGTGH